MTTTTMFQSMRLVRRTPLPAACVRCGGSPVPPTPPFAAAPVAALGPTHTRSWTRVRFHHRTITTHTTLHTPANSFSYSFSDCRRRHRCMPRSSMRPTTNNKTNSNSSLSRPSSCFFSTNPANMAKTLASVAAAEPTLQSSSWARPAARNPVVAAALVSSSSYISNSSSSSSVAAANFLLDRSLYPIGSYTHKVMDQAFAVLDALKHRPTIATVASAATNHSNNTSSSHGVSGISTSAVSMSSSETVSDPRSRLIPHSLGIARTAEANDNDDLEAQRVNLSLALLERLVRELAWHFQGGSRTSNSNSNSTIGSNSNSSAVVVAPFYHHKAYTIGNPHYFNPIFVSWKEVSLRKRKVAVPLSNVKDTTTNSANSKSMVGGVGVASAKEMVQTLQTLSTLLPHFQYNIRTIGMIMQVVIRQAPSDKAPLVAERLLEFVKHEAASWSSSSSASGRNTAPTTKPATLPFSSPSSSPLTPNARTYGLVLSAWADSNRPEAPIRMQALMDEMRTNKIVPNIVAYNILLRFWADRANVERVEDVLAIMAQQPGLELSVLSLAQVLYCYTQVGQTARAEQIMEQMRQVRQPGRELDDKAIAESVQNIMIAYRKRAISPASSYDQKRQALDGAKALVEKIQTSNLLSKESLARVENTQMDIYARAGMLDQVEALFDSSPDPDVVRCGVLIKAYGNCDRADRATDIVHHFLKPDNTVAPNIDIFTSLIDAWAESSRGDAVEQACAVIKLMEENERCRSLGIRPCVVTFSALLKCISESKAASTASDISCQHVESILDTMESRYMAGETNVKPNQISYTLAMKTCFRAGNLAKADAIMKRMEQSDTPPDIRTYSEILQHYSQMATPAAAKRTEQILSYMTELSRSMPSLKPNMYSYSIAMNAWALSGDPDSANRMWKIFERTKQEGLAMDIVFSTALITFLSKIKQRKAMQRAWSVLQEIENGTVHADHRPNARQYMAVIQGFVQAGDAENATLVLLRLVEVYVNSGVPNANKSTLPRDDIDFAFDNNNTTQSWGNSIPEQKKKSHDSGYEPRPSMFHAVALAWIRKGNLIKATALLDKMVELASDTASTSTTTNTNTANSENPGGEDAIRTTAAIVASPSMIPHGPDVGTYNVLLRHWLASSHPDKDVYATKIRNHIDAWHQTRYRSSSSSVNNDLG